METEQKHILYVENSEDDREVYTHFLTRKGFRVSTAENGRVGLEKALELKPDLIVVDLWLPEIGGWQVVERLKRDARTRHIPALAVTGHSPLRPEVVGCQGMLVKPFTPDALLGEILRVLGPAHTEIQPGADPPKAKAQEV